MSLGGATYLAAVKLQRMVSLSATFQAAVGYPGDATSSLTKIGLRALDGAIPRPYAVICGGEKLSYKPIAFGDQVHLRASGGLFLYLARDVDPEDYQDDIQAEFKGLSFFDQVIDEVAQLSAQDDTGSADGTSHLNIVDIERSVFSNNPQGEWQSCGRFQFCGFDISWE